MANTLTFANDTLTDANIFGGIDYKVDLNTGDEFSIGNTASACVSFTTDTQLPLYTKDQTNGTFVWDVDGTDKGRFYITEAKKVDSGYEIEAYDAMILLDTSVTALSISLPVTVSAAASAIAAYIGCTVSGTIINGSMEAQDGTIDDTTTIRQLLSWVAEASGCSVKIDAADHICFMYYADSGITITASDYKEQGLAVADYNCAAIDNVTICDMAGMTAASAGSGTNSLFIQGNPFMYEATSTEAAAILAVVEDFEYAPLTCEMFDEEGLEVGVTATFGTSTTLVMHLESSEDGVTVSSVGSDSRAELNKSLDIIVNEAMAVASDAQQTAQELNLHFWYTATGSEAGAHIAEVDKPTFETNPTGGNLLSNSTGIAVRDGLTELATFGSTITVGKQGGTQAIIDSGSFSIKKTSENFSISLIPTSGNDNGGAVVFGEIGGVADTFIVGTSSATDGFMQLGSGSNLLSIATGSLSNSIRASVGNSYISVQASGIELVSNNGNGNVNIVGEAVIDNGKHLRLNNGVGSSYSWTQIWAGTASSTSNLYLQADGYIGFYVGNTTTAPTGRMYLYYGYLDVYGYTYSRGGYRTNNAQYYYGRNTSGTDRLVCGINSNNDYVFGRGSYDNNEGTVYYDGNAIHIRSKAAIAVNGTSFRPASGNSVPCGTTTYYWTRFYANTAEWVKSDRKAKDVLGDLDFSKDLIMGLNPVQFMLKDSDHRRIHMGFIAQEADAVAKRLDKNLSFIIADYIDEEKGEYLGEEVDDEELTWGLSYTELIAPTIKVVQDQQKEIDMLKAEVEELRRRLS